MGEDKKRRLFPPALARPLLFVLPAGFFLWLLFWIFHFGVTLINDEYLAIDYFYRIVRKGGLYPTPEAFHKPLSVLMGVFAWLVESPLGYEVAVAAFAAVFVVLLYLAAQRELGAGFALLATLAVSFHPGLMYYTAKGSTVVPFCALSFAALVAAQKREEWSGWLWVYAASLFLAGLIRTEPWVLAAPALAWWWPQNKGARGVARLLAALALIGLAPVVWLGKDYFINGDLMHGFKVATRVQVIGTGAPFSLLDSFATFWIKVPNTVSWPVMAAAVAGLVWFVKDKGLRAGLLDPLVVFPVTVSLFLGVVIYLGVYPNYWYFYFDAVFAVIFCVYLLKRALAQIDLDARSGARAALLFAPLLAAIGLFIAQPRSSPPDYRWLLAGLGLMSIFAAAALLWSGEFAARPGPTLVVGALCAVVISFLVFCYGQYERKTSELKLEAEKQEEMVAVADFLGKEIPRGSGQRIMMPSRRNEQLSWQWRKRPAPEVVSLREAFYLDRFKHVNFLDLHPDWIIFIENDYQFRGPNDMFIWLRHQDRTVLGGVEISLVMSTDLIRVFKVTYPPGHPGQGPLPPIP